MGKYYELQIGNVAVKLRLTYSAQKRIEQKVQANDFALLEQAKALKAFADYEPKSFIDIWRQALGGNVRYQDAIFTEALNWKDSGNFVKSADDLFDLMADADICDPESIATILIEVARSAGIINQKIYDDYHAERKKQEDKKQEDSIPAENPTVQ